jgi:hypothetical protein
LAGFADGHNADDRGDPDGDAKNREQAAQLVSEKSHQR